MTQPAVDAGPEVAKALRETNFNQFIEQLKSSKREEVITKTVTLLNEAFQRGLQSKKNPKLQQRWFTICGYLTQVIARVVRDLEYEKLRQEVDELKRQVFDRNVSTPRRTRYSFRHRESKKATAE